MVKFYHTENCGMCKGLESMLKAKNIPYEDIKDEDLMLDMGIKHVPVLDIDGVLYGTREAFAWINQQ